MSNNALLEKKAAIFGSLMLVPNRLDKLMERKMSQFDMTSKQWLLSAIIERAFKKPPTVKEAAKAMGSSHQNVKQVALKLAGKGFLELLKDPKDQRITRLKLTEKSMEFWNAMDATCNEFVEDIFLDISEEELDSMRRSIEKIMANIARMEGNSDEDEEE